MRPSFAAVLRLALALCVPGALAAQTVKGPAAAPPVAGAVAGAAPFRSAPRSLSVLPAPASILPASSALLPVLSAPAGVAPGVAASVVAPGAAAVAEAGLSAAAEGPAGGLLQDGAVRIGEAAARGADVSEALSDLFDAVGQGAGVSIGDAALLRGDRTWRRDRWRQHHREKRRDRWRDDSLIDPVLLDVPRAPAADAASAEPASLPSHLRRYEDRGRTGTALLADLRHFTSRSHRDRGYDDAREYMFSKADNEVRNGVSGVTEVYSQTFIPGTSGKGGAYKERGDQYGDGHVDGQGMNTEHTWPQSFFDKRSPMRSDLHHLLPTFVHPNSERGHLPFGEVTGRVEYSNRAGAKLGGGVFEPPDAAKGRVARALLYFYARYHDRQITSGAFGENFWNSKLEMLLRWNRAYPPTEHEKRRNDRVAEFQGNRNPFTDDPSLADRIGISALRVEGRRRGVTRPHSAVRSPYYDPQVLIRGAALTPN